MVFGGRYAEREASFKGEEETDRLDTRGWCFGGTELEF